MGKKGVPPKKSLRHAHQAKPKRKTNRSPESHSTNPATVDGLSDPLARSTPWKIIADDVGFDTIERLESLIPVSDFDRLRLDIKDRYDESEFLDRIDFGNENGISMSDVKKIFGTGPNPLNGKKHEDIARICRDIDLALEDYIVKASEAEFRFLSGVLREARSCRYQRGQTSESSMVSDEECRFVSNLCREMPVLAPHVLSDDASFARWRAAVNSDVQGGKLSASPEPNRIEFMDSPKQLDDVICSMADWITAFAHSRMFPRKIRQSARRICDDPNVDESLRTRSGYLLVALRNLRPIVKAFEECKEAGVIDIAKHAQMSNEYVLFAVLDRLQLELKHFQREKLTVGWLILESSHLRTRAEEVLRLATSK